jgi:hypothetical protein
MFLFSDQELNPEKLFVFQIQACFLVHPKYIIPSSLESEITMIQAFIGINTLNFIKAYLDITKP